MSDTQTTIEDDTDDGNYADLPETARQHLRKLEKENKRIATLEQENSQLKQQAAIRAAGLNDLNEDQLAALSATHKGESTPEAFRQTAERLKFVEPVPEIDPAVAQAHAQLADARTGNASVPNTSYEDEVATAKSREELKAIALKHNRPWAE